MEGASSVSKAVMDRFIPPVDYVYFDEDGHPHMGDELGDVPSGTVLFDIDHNAFVVEREGENK